jgi:hypothetical protein
MTVKLCVWRGKGGMGINGVFDDGAPAGHFLPHCGYILFMTALFTFRKGKEEFLNLYTSYDGRNIHMDNNPSPKNTHHCY